MNRHLTAHILWAMLAGILFGALCNLLLNWQGAPQTPVSFLQVGVLNGVLDAIGRIFVAALQLLVVPLVFVSLVLGTSALGEHSRMGPMAIKTILLYLATTCIAVSLALLVATLVKPGDGLDLDTLATYEAAQAPALKDVIVGMFPRNPVAAMAEGNMLQIIVFSLLMGLALSKVGEAGRQAKAFFESFNAVIMRMVLLLMELAPYGVFALLATMFASLGLSAILDLGVYFFTVVGVLVVQAGIVYGSLLRLFAGLNPIKFFLNVRPAMLFAFSTASSNATIPVTLRVAEKRLGVNDSIAAFTVPLGATINMDGTAIMQGVATAFIAQAYGIDIGISGYLAVIVTATLASIGTAGVPGVGLIMLSMVLQQVGLPVEGIALILGVDRLLDMMRTAVNILGDSMVATLVSRSEGMFDERIYNETSDEQV